VTINSANALNYGTFSWMTTTNANDTLAFTLFSDAQLAAAGLLYFTPNGLFMITARVLPTNLYGSDGLQFNTASATNLTGSFTTAADTTPPQVSSFSPASGATNVAYDGTQFKVIFNESMDSLDLNNQTTLSASLFSLDLKNDNSGISFVIDHTNALQYGSFSWGSTTFPNDTLIFTMAPRSQLITAGLHALNPSTTYEIVAPFTVPAGLTDWSGNALNTSVGIPSAGTFTTAATLP